MPRDNKRKYSSIGAKGRSTGNQEEQVPEKAYVDKATKLEIIVKTLSRARRLVGKYEYQHL